MRKDILQQARDIRASMDAAASALTDEQSARSPRLYHTLVAGLTVKPGDRLYYPCTDRLYKVRDGNGPHNARELAAALHPCRVDDHQRRPRGYSR